MIGRNEIRFSSAEMMRAVQYYLNTVLLKEPVEVQDIHVERTGTDTYVVSVVNLEEKDGPA